MEERYEQLAWLIQTSGPLAGRRHVVRGLRTVVGRDPQCDVPVFGEDAEVVSSRHLEVTAEGGRFFLTGLGSTNGTFHEGERVTRAELKPGSLIRLGASGPELRFEVTAVAPDALEQTILAGEGHTAGERPAEDHARLLTDAVERARKARRAGQLGQTMHIMREMLETALHRSRRSSRRTIAALVLALAAAVGFGLWRNFGLRGEIQALDAKIAGVERALAEGGLAPPELDRLVRQLRDYQEQARQLPDSVFYRLNRERREEPFVEREIRVLLAEFGAEGAAGLWQFTPATARADGMRVGPKNDERHDLEKSTRAAGRYIRELILDFGTGSSVMLALAAYNLGPRKVRGAVRRLDDPFAQRSFWYLYRIRALPPETREYVPRIIAAIIVGRNVERFGF
jgi:hypothetical protein